MEIDRSLNLVVPVDTPTGTVHVHSTPISQAVFEMYFWEISKTFSLLVTELSSAMVGGPKIAALALKDVASQRVLGPGVNRWNAPDGVERGLMAEIRRLTNAVMPSENGGWEVIPWQDVVNKRLLDEEDVKEVEGVIVFFICTAAMVKRQQLEGSLLGMQRLWDVLPTSSRLTEFVAGLPTLTATASSGATPPTSSVPQ